MTEFPRRETTKLKRIFLALVFMAVLEGCASPTRTEIPILFTATPTRTVPTEPPTATSTPLSSATLIPAKIPTPTFTISPNPPTPTSTPGSAGQNNVDQVLQICQHLPSDPFLRAQSLFKSTFTPDISPAARAQLPGFTAIPSCNFYGKDVPEVIVVHYTAGELSSSLNEFVMDHGASAQYIIDRNGKVTQMVPERLGALHVNCNGVRSNCLPSCPICFGPNDALTEPYTRSVGIELVNNGHIPTPAPSADPATYYYDYLKSFGYFYWDEFPDAQIASLKILIKDIAARWNIPIDINHVIGHYRINQKDDPGPALNLFWTRPGNPSRPPIFGANGP